MLLRSSSDSSGSNETRRLSETDLGYLKRTLELAEKGRYGASPNPMVGGVLVRDGQVLGEGYHRQVGGPHGEIEALMAAGHDARGATLYVNLEPCDFHGRTPACSKAMIEAGISRVVACHRDPDWRVSGGGFDRMQAAGISVEHGFMIEEAVRLNWRYLVAATQPRPAVTLKWAMSLDGRIATVGGDSQWISSPEGRDWALDLRERHDAILIGSGTALTDDPRLNRRLSKTPGPILRVVLDRRLRLEPTARMLAVEGPLLIYTSPSADVTRQRQLTDAGAEVVTLGEVNPREVLADLRKRGISSVLVEGGSQITATFVESELYDQVGVCCAPLVIGGQKAPGPLAGEGFVPLQTAPRLTPDSTTRRGPDWILTAFRKSCLPELCANVGG